MAIIPIRLTSEGIFDLYNSGSNATGLTAGDTTEIVNTSAYESIAVHIRGEVGTTPSIRVRASPDGVNFSNLLTATAAGLFQLGNSGYPWRLPFMLVSATGSASMDVGITVVGMKRNMVFG